MPATYYGDGSSDGSNDYGYNPFDYFFNGSGGSDGSNSDGGSSDFGSYLGDLGSYFGLGNGGSSDLGGSDGSGSTDPFGSGGSGSNGSSSSGSDASGLQAATSSESTGVVLINTELGYGTGEAAGTGLVLNSNGTIITNHHVIADSTSITVTDPSTSKTYTADVVGYDATDDVAVLKLEGASGLQPVTTDKAGVSIGEAVTAVGNADGAGSLSAADGSITATNQDITVSDDNGGTESLQNLIQVNADIIPGDSGRCAARCAGRGRRHERCRFERNRGRSGLRDPDQHGYLNRQRDPRWPEGCRPDLRLHGGDGRSARQQRDWRSGCRSR